MFLHTLHRRGTRRRACNHRPASARRTTLKTQTARHNVQAGDITQPKAVPASPLRVLFALRRQEGFHRSHQSSTTLVATLFHTHQEKANSLSCVSPQHQWEVNRFHFYCHRLTFGCVWPTFPPATSKPKQVGFHKVDACTNLLEADFAEHALNAARQAPGKRSPAGPSPTPTKDHARPPAHTTRSRPPKHSQTQTCPSPTISSTGIVPSQCCFFNLGAVVIMTSRC